MPPKNKRKGMKKGKLTAAQKTLPKKIQDAITKKKKKKKSVRRR